MPTYKALAIRKIQAAKAKPFYPGSSLQVTPILAVKAAGVRVIATTEACQKLD
jgi:hypothetical protein